MHRTLIVVLLVLLTVIMGESSPSYAQEGVAARRPVPGPVGGAQPADAPAVADTCSTATVSAVSGLFIVRYQSRDTWCVIPPPDTRITSRTAVRVRVEGLNHLRYALSMDVQEATSESYQYLERLWGSVLGGGLGAFGSLAVTDADREKELRQAIFELYKATLELDKTLAAASQPFQAIGLLPSDRALLRDHWQPQVRLVIAAAKERSDRLQAVMQADADTFFLAQGKYAAYVKEAGEGYKTVVGKASTFLTLSTLAIDGEERAIGTKKAGTRITANLHATSGAGAKLWLADLSYVVQSERPLVAHGGVAFGGPKDVTFAKVQRANGFSSDDFFQKQDENGQTTDFIAFLGWEIYSGATSRLSDTKNSGFSVMASLGTAISAPGKKIYIGPSLGWGRFVLTGGAVIGQEKDGEEQVQEPNLFRAVKDRTSTKGFVAITVRVF